ncbi:MAG: hypothetical protein H0Z40_05635 [Desulfotomaculum sp.]|nr:hypothetical protein [Desulfotomaculum sp.]
MVGKSDKAGEVEFTVNDPELFNSDVKDYTLFYNIVENARFKLFRSNKMELVLVHITEDWLRQAKIDISGYSGQITIKVSWTPEEDKLAVKGDGEEEYITAKAVQVDN